MNILQPKLNLQTNQVKKPAPVNNKLLNMMIKDGDDKSRQ